jgi:L-malate glycosyltransferase
MNTSKRIIAFHLLNDRSGSPKVLSQILFGWVQEGRDVVLYTSLHQDGFLSDISGINYRNAWYRFKSNPWLRLIYYSLSQLILFFELLSFLKKSDIVYINTVLPFGAALAGKIKGARVIYHIHESTVNPPILKWFLFKMVSWTASDIINVSEYVAASHCIKSVTNHLVYNSIDESFLARRLPKKEKEKPENVLMVCSLKGYKGVFEFITLANDHPQYQFRLVFNAAQPEIDAFFKGHLFSNNISVYAAQKDLHPFFQWADVIVNLSRPDGWVETFGLTIIEGMAYGLPAIVPPVGGILEVIQEGLTGYSEDSRNRDVLNSKLIALMQDPNKYHDFAVAAEQRLLIFKETTMLNKINTIIQN